MPRYDVRCPQGHADTIITRWDDRQTPCRTCGAPTERVWVTATAVIGDEIDYVDDNLGPEPIRIRSKAERRRLMKERGLVEAVRHVGTQGSDRSPHTQRWDTCPAALLVSEADRIAQWHAWDAAHGIVNHPVERIEVATVPTFGDDEMAHLSRVAAGAGF